MSLGDALPERRNSSLPVTKATGLLFGGKYFSIAKAKAPLCQIYYYLIAYFVVRAF